MDKTEVEQLRARVEELEERERRAWGATGVTWQPGGRLEEEITRLRIAATGAPDAWRAAADEWVGAGGAEGMAEALRDVMGVVWEQTLGGAAGDYWDCEVGYGEIRDVVERHADALRVLMGGR